jgi:hypothetical protein
MISSKTETPKSTNRRVSPRRAARGKVECRVGAVGQGRNVADVLEDISQTGARLVVTDAIVPGRRVELRFSGWGHARPLVITGKVVWCALADDEAYRIGVRLEKNLSYEDLQMLS